MSGPSAFYPMYPADYRAKTHGLSLAEHGAYNLLLMEYWIRGGPLPDDDRVLARICGCSEKEWLKVSEAVRHYFPRATIDGKRVITNKRIEEELAHARGRYQRAVAGADATNRAKAEARARLEARIASSQADAKPDAERELSERSNDATGDAKTTQTHNSQLTEEKAPSLRSGGRSRKAKTSIPDHFPDDDGRRRAQEAWSKKGRPDLAASVLEEMEAFRDHHISQNKTSADWPASWRTWIKNAPKFTPQQRMNGHGRRESPLEQSERISREIIREDAGDEGANSGADRVPRIAVRPAADDRRRAPDMARNLLRGPEGEDR